MNTSKPTQKLLKPCVSTFRLNSVTIILLIGLQVLVFPQAYYLTVIKIIKSTQTKLFVINFKTKPTFSLPSFDLHEALDLGSVERINNGLPFGDLELRPGVGDGGGDRRRIRELLVVAKPCDASPLNVLPDVVIRELGGSSKKRSEERENFTSRWSHTRH